MSTIQEWGALLTAQNLDKRQEFFDPGDTRKDVNMLVDNALD